MRLLVALALAASLAQLVGCHADDVGAVPMEGIASAEVVSRGAWEWSADGDCSPCHANAAEATAASRCEAFSSVDRPCQPCHGDASALRAAHELPFARSESSGLRRTDMDDSACSGCHDAALLAAATFSQELLSDADGTLANPHALPETEGHASIGCADCHNPHSAVPIGESSKELCLSCHHQNVYECYTCHE